MKNLIFSFILLSATTYAAYSQACSDAGICSAPVFGDSKDRFLEIEVKQGLESADYDVTILKTYFSAKVDFSDEWMISLSIPYASISGENMDMNNESVSISGLSDITFMLANKFMTFNDGAMRGYIGLKVPSGNDNMTDDDGNFLPMVFQPSLGTTDLLLMLTLDYDTWHFAAGWQKPLDDHNNNKYVGYYDEPVSRMYPSSFDLERQSDLMLRVTKSFFIAESFNASFGIMPIFRLGESLSSADMVNNSPVAIEGTSGTTLNIIGDVNYSAVDYLDIFGNFGFPVISRKTSADGLKRSFVINAGFRFRF